MTQIFEQQEPEPDLKLGHKETLYEKSLRFKKQMQDKDQFAREVQFNTYDPTEIDLKNSPIKHERYNKIKSANDYSKFEFLANNFDDLANEIGTSYTMDFVLDMINS